MKRRQSSVTLDVDELGRALAEATGVQIGVPETHSAGMYGFEVNGRLIFHKDIEGYALAHQASLLRTGAGICEIGAGAGHSAYYHEKFGASRVYLFDLPSVAAVTIWFLSRIEGPDSVCTFGETPNDSHKYFISQVFPSVRRRRTSLNSIVLMK